jgi:hypothetical protein
MGPAMRVKRLLVVAVAVVASTVLAGPAAARADGIAYHTYFQHPPGLSPPGDHSLEQHAVDLIDATPAGERIGYAFRDFNSVPITDALLRAAARGVALSGVIDGDEWTQLQVQRLWTGLGPEQVTVCGHPTFELNSCIADTLRPGLMHNKFLTFSRLSDGRADVVLETSENFFGPSQFNYFNDMVEIDGDSALYDVYQQYIADLRAQVRSDDHYEAAPLDGPDTVFLSPRRQEDRDHQDTIVDQLREIDCSQGGAPDGHGLVRVANMAFRSERAVIMRTLVDLHRAGCDVEVILTNADGDILAGLVAAGIPTYPLFLRQLGSAPNVTRSPMVVHDKFFLVDALSTRTGERTKLTYAGTSNWRADEQQSDDLLLRIADDGVYDAYSGYWDYIRSRVASEQSRPAVDTVPPASAATVSPEPNAAGWNRSDVTVRIAASDGHNVNASGLKALHVTVATNDGPARTLDFAGETSGYSVQEIPVTEEGTTQITYWPEDNKGNPGTKHTVIVHLDKTAPSITGLPDACRMWPPDHEMVHVADIGATDALTAAPDLVVTGASNASDDEGDIAIDGGSVDLRAEKADQGAERDYRLTATATDAAGNTTAATATCVVPHSMGHRP